MNDLEIVSAHARDGELRPGCHLNSSKHTRFEDNERPGDRRGGTQPDPIPFRVTPRRSADRPHPSMLHHTDLDGRDATDFWHEPVEPQPHNVVDDIEYTDPSASSTPLVRPSRLQEWQLVLVSSLQIYVSHI